MARCGHHRIRNPMDFQIDPFMVSFPLDYIRSFTAEYTRYTQITVDSWNSVFKCT